MRNDSLNCIRNLLIVISLVFSFSHTAIAIESSFDHDKTGFELTGPHSRTSCDSCHLRGIFKGTPKQCNSCHDSINSIATITKPANHIQTTGSCESCHAGSTWAVTRVDHDNVKG